MLMSLPFQELDPNFGLRNRIAIGLALLARIGTSLDRGAKGSPNPRQGLKGFQQFGQPLGEGLY